MTRLRGLKAIPKAPPKPASLDAMPKLRGARGKRAKELDLRCPIRCGQCCAQSNFDPKLGKMTLTKGDTYRDKPTCPHLKKRGCNLPRRDRPYDCTGYICPVARAVRDKRITLRQGQDLAEASRPWLVSELKIMELERPGKEAQVLCVAT